jgi:5-(carboxyamino)imidazole ribonucleotide synthase
MLYDAAAMKNVLGEAGHEGKTHFTNVAEALSLTGVTVHNYGKKTTKPGRKMGHVNIVGTQAEVASNLKKINVKSISE